MAFLRSCAVRAGCVLLGAGVLAAGAVAQESPLARHAGDVDLRVALMHVDPDGGGSLAPVSGEPVIGDSLGGIVAARWFPLRVLALEIALAASRHDVRLEGVRMGSGRRRAFDLGSVGLLSPSASVQLHPFPDWRIRPYVGAGVIGALLVGPSDDRLSYRDTSGLLLQAGLDWQVTPRLGLNIEVRRTSLKPEARVLDGFGRADLDFDAWVVAGGVTWRF